MQEEQADPQATEEPSAEAEGGARDQGDEQVAAAVDQQAAESSGAAAEAAPEVPDDASQKIAAAQEHIDSLNMEQQREAAKRAM